VAPAALLAVAGGEAQALSLCVHALRVVGATAEAGGLVEIADQLVQLAGKSQAGSIEELSRAESACPLWRPTSITCHLDSSTAVPPSTGSDSSDLGVLVVSLADLVPIQEPWRGSSTMLGFDGMDQVWSRHPIGRFGISTSGQLQL